MNEAIQEVEAKKQKGIAAATSTKWTTFKRYLRQLMTLLIGWGIFYKEILPRLYPAKFAKAGF